MLGAGDTIPAATVWTRPNERRTVAELLRGGEGRALVFFYLFDWSST